MKRPPGLVSLSLQGSGRTGSDDFRKSCRRLNRNGWKPRCTNCGCHGDSLNFGDRESKDLSPSSAMEATLLGIWDKLLIFAESRFPVCKGRTIRLPASKVEIYINKMQRIKAMFLFSGAAAANFHHLGDLK